MWQYQKQRMDASAAAVIIAAAATETCSGSSCSKSSSITTSRSGCSNHSIGVVGRTNATVQDVVGHRLQKSK